MKSRKHLLHGSLWIGVYIFIIVAPLLVLLVGQPPPGRGFWREVSVGLGFIGLSMMGLQFFLTGRFKFIEAPYGIDVLYHFHRQISLIAFSLLLLHPIILIAIAPATWKFFNPIQAPWWAMVGVAGLAGFALIIFTSLKRLALGIRYETWRLSHSLLSMAAATLGLAHILGVGYYLQDPLKQGLWIALGSSWIIALLFIRLVRPLAMLKRPYIVERVTPERGQTWTLALKPLGHEGLRFRPGQFAWLTIGKSPFAVREHPFSFSSSSLHEGSLEIAIKELGDFTSQIGKVTPGTRAYLDGPYGTFTVDRHRRPGYVFIAAGVGITPIMSMLRTLADRRDLRPLLLFYNGKTWEDLTFREELEALGKQLNLHTVYILSEQAPEGWPGERGRITAEVLARHLPVDRMEYEYFICGPHGMQIAVKKDINRLGLPLENVQSESFNYV
jgi:predicted ferric reductase